MRNILCNVINPISANEAAFLPRQIITIKDGVITSVRPDDGKTTCEDYSDKIALPGFIDLHVHLSQYMMRGLYEPALLPWLNRHVFPEEARSADTKYAQNLAQLFFNALCSVGTTMSVIYTAPFPTACQTAFEQADAMGIRALIGMTMMDRNSPDKLLQNTNDSLQQSIELFYRWHGKNPMLDYIFTPRFAPTCSMELMQDVARFADNKNAWVQTHLSENTDELSWVKELFGLSSYTEVYQKAGLLRPKSIFGHAIHLSSQELVMLKEHDAKIAHCPDSNFYLKSGEYPLQQIVDAGISFGLGSDVGAGTSLNLLHHTKMMNFRQSSNAVLPANALYHITLGSAKLLGMDNSIGSIAKDKEADIVFLSPPPGYSIGEQSLSQLVFFGTEFRVTETLVAGHSLYKA
jgi:guanine deaminase